MRVAVFVLTEKRIPEIAYKTGRSIEEVTNLLLDATSNGELGIFSIEVETEEEWTYSRTIRPGWASWETEVVSAVA